VRTLIKRLAESVLASDVLGPIVQLRRRDRVLILAYHNVLPPGVPVAGDASLHMPFDTFVHQLDAIAESGAACRLDVAFRDGRRWRVALTFDDAYRGLLRWGVPELDRRGIPATIFVTPAFVGGRSFWWDVLAGEAGLADAVRVTAIENLGGDDARVRAWAEEAGVRSIEPPAHLCAADEAELSAAVATGSITLASHTWSHPNLCRVESERLDDELARPLAWLRERYESVLTWLSYPYGLTAPHVETAVRKTGYEGGLLVDGGWCGRGAGPSLRTPRLNVPAGISPAGFRLRLSGLAPRRG
jgi:peptidoglycan/xylan/chitin deacetylase (PgdA/CDA1 family)